MKNTVFSKVKLFLGTVLFVSVLMLISCQPAANPEIDSTTSDAKVSEVANLSGTWEASAYESYKIAEDSFESVGTYAGNSAVVQKLTDTSGTIFVKYTKAYDWTAGVNEDPKDDTYLYTYGTWYPLDSKKVGKWYAISYKDLTETSVKISGAYKADGKTVTETLEEAKTEFTIENGYFGTYSECVKK